MEYYSFEESYLALQGSSHRIDVDWEVFKNDDRNRFLAIQKYFWQRVASTARSLPVVSRHTDGTRHIDQKLWQQTVTYLQPLAVTNAIETWLSAVTEWLNSCYIDEFIIKQPNYGGIRLVRQNHTELTAEVADHMDAAIWWLNW